MVFHHRKLIPQLCELICHTNQEPCLSDCKVCIKLCLTNPDSYSYYYSQPPPPPPKPLYLDQHEDKHHKISTYLILSLSILLAAFFVVCFHAIYTKFFKTRTRVSISSREEIQENHDDFLDQEHGPIVDHPIWYIRTHGLHESIISAITVCKYKKGEGLIEGTECSVCLNEFQENESLRLLPKCHHAFHLPCIDTWLVSHTNCPMCRAPIVTNPTRIPSIVPNNVVVDAISLQNSDPEGPELVNRAEEGEGELDIEDETSVVVMNIRPRRSVSLDSSSVANIDLQSLPSNVRTTSNSKRSLSFRTRYLHSVMHSSMKRSNSYSSSQRKQNASLRSF